MQDAMAGLDPIDASLRVPFLWHRILAYGGHGWLSADRT